MGCAIMAMSRNFEGATPKSQQRKRSIVNMAYAKHKAKNKGGTPLKYTFKSDVLFKKVIPISE